jgi:hypothetical protein
MIWGTYCAPGIFVKLSSALPLVNKPAGVLIGIKGGAGSDYLASLDNYPLISEKSRYDLNNDIDLLWGDFQNPLLFWRILCLDGEVSHQILIITL